MSCHGSWLLALLIFSVCLHLSLTRCYFLLLHSHIWCLLLKCLCWHLLFHLYVFVCCYSITGNFVNWQITSIRIKEDFCNWIMETLSSLFFFSTLQLVKQAVLPRVHALALKTTVAAVCNFGDFSYSDYLMLIIASCRICDPFYTFHK